MPVLNPKTSTSSVCAALFLSVLLQQGCQSGSKRTAAPTVVQHDMLSQIDRWTVTVPNDQAVEAAVVTQRVLYDYHFVEGTDRLTQNGIRDLGILVRHFNGLEWQLNIKRGDVDAVLYEKRVDAVEFVLSSSGLDLALVVISDGLPGGNGLSSEDARRIRKDSLEGAGALESGSSETARPVFDTPIEGGF